MLVKGFEVDGLIKVDNARVYGMEESIIASGYPMSTNTYNMELGKRSLEVKEKDDKRAKHLGNAIVGSGHDCYLKGIILQFDMQVSEYIWRQWDRYHFNDYVSSQSKMHRILKLDIDKSCNKYVLEETIENLNELIEAYNDYENIDEEEIDLRSGEEIAFTKENIFNMIIANCPCGVMLTARVTLNYLQLKSMISQRENHKMQEWRYLTDWFKQLPNNELFTK